MKNKGNIILITVLCIMVIAVVGGAVYLVTLNKEKESESQKIATKTEVVDEEDTEGNNTKKSSKSSSEDEESGNSSKNSSSNEKDEKNNKTSKADEEDGDGKSNKTDITKENYGQYVDIGTDILDKTNITLSDGEKAKADWRVFRKEADGVWLIMSDYLPITKIPSAVGLNTSGTYGVYSTKSRVDLIERLSDKEKWSSLISGSEVAGISGVTVQGAVDLDTYVNSWNEKYPNNSKYTTNQIYTAKTASAMSDKLYGYYVSRTNNPPTTSEYYVSMLGSEGYETASKADTLYYPHASGSSAFNGCYGYWLASPSALGANAVVYVNYDGSVYASSYDYSRYGVRPAVFLPSSIKLNTTGEVCTIADNQ